MTNPTTAAVVVASSVVLLLGGSRCHAFGISAPQHPSASSSSRSRRRHFRLLSSSSSRSYSIQLNAAVGIFFGTSTGSTQECADKIYEAFGGDDVAAEPVDVDTLEAGESLSKVFGAHDALIVGTPTWNTGADTERSGTGWDELYYDQLPSLKSVLDGKKVAVFGLGDQISYSDNYADAAGELYDVFTDLGCNMVEYAMTSPDTYEHENSKSLRGDKFCGLLLDQVNQEDLTDERVEAWVAQLKAGGFLEAGGGSGGGTTTAVNAAGATASPPAVVEETAPAVATNTAAVIEDLSVEEHSSSVPDQSIVGSQSSGSYTPHYNPVTGKTMWTSPDGRKSFVTTDTSTTLSP